MTNVFRFIAILVMFVAFFAMGFFFGYAIGSDALIHQGLSK